MYRISPALDAPGGVLRLDASSDAPSLCVLPRSADASAKSARTYDSEHWIMTGLTVLYIALLGVCILSSGFFSGSETALVGVPRERVHQHVGGKRGKHVEALLAHPEEMLSTLLVANNFVNILGAAIATVLFIDLVGEDWGPWGATAAVTAVILVVGEITPKSLATRYPMEFALIVAPTVWRLSLVLEPISRVFRGAAQLLMRLFGIRSADVGMTITEDDIRAMAVLGEREGEIDAAEREIIHALFSLADRPVREVMTPRVDMVTLDSPVTMEALRRATAAAGHSRFPVIDGDLDHVIGILYVKDLMRLDYEPDTAAIQQLLREPVYVPETKSVLELLQDMRVRKLAFAVVLDEHGGIEGLVTVKDVISELVGELSDEYDPGQPSIIPIGTRRWLADGRLAVEELATWIGVDIEEGPYATVAGLYLHLAGSIPSEGDSVVADGLILTVQAMDRRRIDRLVVQTTHSDDGGGTADLK